MGALFRFDGRGLALLLGAPVAIGLLLGWGRAGQLAPQLSYFGAVGYWVGFSLGIWWLMAGCTQLVAVLLRRRIASVAVVALLGGVLATLLTRPFAFLYSGWVLELANIQTLGKGVSLALWPRSLDSMWLAIIRSAEWIATWVAANLVASRWRGDSRLDGDATESSKAGLVSPGELSTAVTVPPSPASGSVPLPAIGASEPAFLARARKPLGTHLVALQAQDHYIRVFTTVGDELLLYRFSDALREAGEASGVRVHRSWWIASNAIRRVIQRGPRIAVELTNGMRVPVSRTFVESLRRVVAGRQGVPCELPGEASSTTTLGTASNP